MPTPIPAGWKPIESAPKTGRTLLLGYWNSHGNWRTVRGQWMTADYIAEFWEEPDDVEEGWFETAVEADDMPNCWPVSPSHWQPVPAPPCRTCNDQGAVGNILTAEPCPDCTPPSPPQNAPISVALDPDPRGVSVGVWQGSHCIYTEAHAVPVAPGDAQDERQAFEAWAKTQADTWLLVGGLQWSPGTNDYASTRTNAAWEAWKTRASIAAPAAGDALDAKRYRWLRHEDREEKHEDDGAIYVRQVQLTSGVITGSAVLVEEDLDAAIDAALAAQQGKGGA